jgi:pre-mRNA-splicing factor ATP-dependent RNA helicase DHX15/PRP43
MADRRPEELDVSHAKRVKTSIGSASNMASSDGNGMRGVKGLNPAANPYLAHMYENKNPLSKFQRHKTTAAQAHTAEDGPNNPFNGAPLSQNYFSILKTRRDLPVHRQR